MESPAPLDRLSTCAVRRDRRMALILAAATLFAVSLCVLAIGPIGARAWMAPGIGAVTAAVTYRAMTAKIRRRRRILDEPFPAAWEAVLQSDVLF